MRDKISYEWVVSFMDEHGDIQDQDYFDTYAEALRHEATGGNPFVHTGKTSSMIEVWKSLGNDEDGLADREMYKVESGTVDADLPKFIRDQIK
jgi:hypothetical protein|tara:strand:+ start:207 stop:485 length:279 start_codon:yes stop_codon:yes gene_type:complete